MKFSLVIPVYNVEKYIKRCLESIKQQTYDNFEVIIINDGSPDNSQAIIDGYVLSDDRFKSYIKQNGGLSDARNFGVQYATGDYIIFIDSDDYIEKDLLLKLSESASGYDMIRYNLRLVDEEGNLIKEARGLGESRNVSFKELMNIDYFETAWSYAYNLAFWKNNNFMYEVGKIHEDFGLTPVCAILAYKIYYLDYFGYNYVQRQGSIMNGSEKAKKRAYDVLYHFDNISKKIDKISVNETNKQILLSYIANGAISAARLLENEDLNEYVLQLKSRRIYKYILADSLERKIKKLFIKIALKQYIICRFKNKRN